MDESTLTAQLGARMLGEANDLKRTVTALAEELGCDASALQEALDGKRSLDETRALARRMVERYPIDPASFELFVDDCSGGARIMHAPESASSSRVFCRADRHGRRTPYYEYRDTATARLSPFKPEWIRLLRTVHDDDPRNPEVAFNRGHFLHQYTFFVGPVNFYWEIDGTRHARAMSTGDSAYITPLWPHTFASRDAAQTAYIVAVTFGGHVSRAQREIVALGRRALGYRLSAREPSRAFRQLVEQHMANEAFTPEILASVLRARKARLDLDRVLNSPGKLSIEELTELAACLNLDLGDLLLPEYRPEEELCIAGRTTQATYLYPDDETAAYELRPLVRMVKLSHAKGFDVRVRTDRLELGPASLRTGLHSYAFNYGCTPVRVRWSDGREAREAVLEPLESAYFQPFVEHCFARTSGAAATLCLMRVSGSVSLEVQRELACFSDAERVVRETGCWFS